MKINESKLDTITDMAGYSLIAWLVESGLWDKKLMTEWSGEPSAFFNEVQKVFWKKLESYGFMDFKEEGINGVLSRMTDKLARLKNLSKISDNLKVVGKNIHEPKLRGDIGFDLLTEKMTIIEPRSNHAVDVATDVRVKIPTGYWGMIINRSSTPRKRGLMVMPGVIDNGYIGPLYSCVWNTTDKEVVIEKGERIAQLILFPSIVFPMERVDKLEETDRGESGFGSTDV